MQTKKGEDKMAYKQYFKNTRKITEEPKVTIGAGKSGNLYLNTFAMRTYFSGIKYATLFYDDEKKYFEIRPARERVKGAYSLGFSSKRSQSTGYLAAKGFVNQPFVKNSKGKQLPAIWKTKDKKGYLEIKL